MCHDAAVSQPPGPELDASRRTHLAEERTFLAWIRSGLAALAVSLAVGRLLPELLEQDEAAYRWLGLGYGLLGIFLIGYGALRQRLVDRRLQAGEFAPLPAWVPLGVGIAGVALGLATVAILVSVL
jgi:putative membrane protein